MTGDAAIGIDLNSINLEALSRRIVEAARLAVAVHLYESVQTVSRAPDSDGQQCGRRIRIGEAGPVVADGGEAAIGRKGSSR